VQYRQSYEHTYGLGGALASALLPPASAATLTTADWRLRSELTRLLGEHVALAVTAMRSGYAHWPDFDAAAANLNANTMDVTQAVDGIFGANAARSFQSLWADHIDSLMQYTAALAMHDNAKRAAAVTRMNKFQDSFAAFLAGATGNRLPLGDLTSAMVMHDQMLIQQIDAFAAKRYQQAHDVAYTTYTDIGGLSGKLATAFAATAMAKAPRGGIQTGYGGMAPLVERR
jgi:hypothetical protein